MRIALLVATLWSPLALASTAELHAVGDTLALRATTAADPVPYEQAAALAHALAESDDPVAREAGLALLETLVADDLVRVGPVYEPVSDGIEADDRAMWAVADLRIARARAALRAGDHAAAIDILAPIRGTRAWVEARPFYLEAVDAWVAEERERAGELYAEARKIPRRDRRAAMLEVRAILAHLVDRFPEAALHDAVAANLERVERELELLPEAREPATGAGSFFGREGRG